MDLTKVSRFADPHAQPPAAVERLSAGQPVTPVWINSEGGIAFRIGGDAARFVKWAPAGSDLDLAAEADRLRWASHYAKVPRVLGWGADSSGSWLVTSALVGETAVSNRWKAEPETAVRVAGAALRELHEALPVAQCPFDWSIGTRLIRAGLGVSADKVLAEAPPIDQLVVCHGGACVPNTLIDMDGTFAGHVGMGQLGIADRWADIAIGSWSTEWNYGPGWENVYFEAYGIAADLPRIGFYRQLWDYA